MGCDRTPYGDNMIPEKLRVLIVDDNERSLNQLFRIFQEIPYIEVVGKATYGEQALEWVRAEKPDLITMDFAMPGMDGIETSVEIKKIMPDVKILMITSIFDKKSLFQALEKGIDLYILKPFDKDVLVECIDRIFENA